MKPNATQVAVLLATYNGSPFIEAQIESLNDNLTSFTLHWIDDQSTDNTREMVRKATDKLRIPLKEWHQTQHLGVPRVFFWLMECVEADIYLFCDQDDVWQPGKIDATVANLITEVKFPVLCFFDVLVFTDDEPRSLRRLSEMIRASTAITLQESKILVFNRVMGNTVGFTRPLRELFLRHKAVANAHAVMHDWWMHLIAVASGTRRMLCDVPTTLWRLHGNNTAGKYMDLLSWRGLIPSHRMWQYQQAMRVYASQQARAFCLASETLPRGPKLEMLLSVARVVGSLDRRQSPIALIQLARRGGMPPIRSWKFWFTIACLCSHARNGPPHA